MSDHMPFDLQEEIIKRLPTESLLKFRAVSKQWKCLIDSAKFIADYNPQSHNMHICYEQVQYGEYKYVKIIDNDTFPLHKSSLTVPSCDNFLRDRDVIGYSHGLFCLFSHYPDKRGYFTNVAVIWNPSIRKSVDIVVPSMGTTPINCFGVCRETNDPKILMMMAVDSETLCPYNYKVEVFTLSSGLWRRPLSNLPDKWFQIRCGNYPVVIDGFIYWFALYDEFYIIVSFDLTIEEFKHVYLPDKLAFDDERRCDYRPIYKLRESLVVVQYDLNTDKQVYRVWMMDNSVSKSFTEIFTVNIPYAPLRRILGFRNNGELIMEERISDSLDRVTLIAYEPGSEHIKRLGIYGEGGSCSVVSYKESLLLLDQSNTLTNVNSRPRVKTY